MLIMQHCENFTEKTWKEDAVTSICHRIPHCSNAEKRTNDDAVLRTLSVDAYSKRLVPLTNYMKTALEHRKSEKWDKEKRQDRGEK